MNLFKWEKGVFHNNRLVNAGSNSRNNNFPVKAVVMKRHVFAGKSREYLNISGWAGRSGTVAQLIGIWQLTRNISNQMFCQKPLK